MRLYEHPASGNCLKCRVLLRQLGIPFETVLVDLFRGRARVHQWMFFEQNQIEAQLASARFMALTGRAEAEPEVFAAKVAAARRALDSLERGLADGRAFVVGDVYTVADVALHGYVHCGAEGGADPAEHPHVRDWVARVEATPGFENDLAPIPEHAQLRRG
jgi:glutathione S-transferase